MNWYTVYIGGEYYGLVLALDRHEAATNGLNRFGCYAVGTVKVCKTNRKVKIV